MVQMFTLDVYCKGIPFLWEWYILEIQKMKVQIKHLGKVQCKNAMGLYSNLLAAQVAINVQ